MRKVQVCDSWVVYSVERSAGRSNVICEQKEWELIVASRTDPTAKQLVRAGIGNEQEAEKIARGTSGDAFKAGYRRNLVQHSLRSLRSARR
jgi:hypothetical protein